MLRCNMPISEQLLIDIASNTFDGDTLDFRPHTDAEVIYDADLIRLSEALKKNPRIKKINLHHNGVGDKGIEALTQVQSLEELDLSNGLFGYDDHYNDITFVGVQFIARSNLKKVNLGGNRRIGDKGAEALAQNATITDLDIGECGITDAGAKTLIATNRTITKLTLSSNDIGDDGVSTIHLNHTLRELYLSYCDISTAGAEALARNDSLAKLELRDNKINAAGAKYLSQHPRLQYLRLSGCQIGDEGAFAFANNRTLQVLELYGNGITRAGAGSLVANMVLLQLNLEGNLIGTAADISALTRCYSSNDDLVFTRTHEFIERLLKKTRELVSAAVLPKPSAVAYTPYKQFQVAQPQIAPQASAKELTQQLPGHPDEVSEESPYDHQDHSAQRLAKKQRGDAPPVVS